MDCLIQRIYHHLNGDVLALGSPDNRIKYVCIDSRYLIRPENTLFFAFDGKHSDGHEFIPTLYVAGVRSFIITKEIDLSCFPDANFLRVEDARIALQETALLHREAFDFPFIAVTGSVGKTVVKEWLYSILHTSTSVFRSPRSYNSQLGVPLSLLQIEHSDRYAIIEAGISEQGEMNALKKIIQPTIGILTKITDQHQEGFRSEREKLLEKLSLFADCEKIICAQTDPHFDTIRSIFPQERLWTWGYEANCDIQILSLKKSENESAISLLLGKHHFNFTLPFEQDDLLYNWMLCFATLAYMGYSMEEMLPTMYVLPIISMKLEVARLASGGTLIHDTHNVDIYSLIKSLNKLKEQTQHNKFTIFLSDIEPIREKEDAYLALADRIRQFPSLRLILIGESISKKLPLLLQHSAVEIHTYKSVEDFIATFSTQIGMNEGILIHVKNQKHFLLINEYLVGKTHSTVLEINLTKLRNNITVLLSHIPPQVKVMAMVKAFSYGSGSYEIAQLIERHRFDYLAVAYVDEGIELRSRNIRMNIMVMNIEVQHIPMLIKYQLEPVVYSVFVLKQLAHYCKTNNIAKMPIHLELETGMNRLGISEEELDEVKNMISTSTCLVVKSVFSHLVASENPSEDAFTSKQVESFSQKIEKIKQFISYPFIRHIANSAASIRTPAYQFDMVRLGISMYGYDPSQTLHSIEPIFCLKTSIAQIKNVHAGERVGYGNCCLQEDKTIATIRVGYADGFPRILGNGKGYVMIRGKKAPVVGHVCMDMTMVDVTHIPDVQLSDQVELFGEKIAFVDFCTSVQKIPYEVMVGFPNRINRIYIEE